MFFDLYKEYSSCLISFLSFSELFPAFNWDKKLVIYEAFDLVLVFLSPFIVDIFVYAANSSLSKSGMSVVSDCLSDCCVTVSDSSRLIFDLKSLYSLPTFS